MSSRWRLLEEQWPIHSAASTFPERFSLPHQDMMAWCLDHHPILPKQSSFMCKLLFLRAFSTFVGQNVLRSESLFLSFSLFPPMCAFCCASKPALVPCLCQPAQQTGHHHGEQVSWVTAAQVSLLLWKHTDAASFQLKSYYIFHSREHGCNLAWRSWV